MYTYSPASANKKFKSTVWTVGCWHVAYNLVLKSWKFKQLLLASIWGRQCTKVPGSSWLCIWNLTIDEQCQHCDLFCLPLSIPADSSTSWIPWLSHREAAEWTANGTTPVHCSFVSDPWRLLSAFEQTWDCCPLKAKVKSICWHLLTRSLIPTGVFLQYAHSIWFFIHKIWEWLDSGQTCSALNSTTYRSNYSWFICDVMALYGLLSSVESAMMSGYLAKVKDWYL